MKYWRSETLTIVKSKLEKILHLLSATAKHLLIKTYNIIQGYSMQKFVENEDFFMI